MFGGVNNNLIHTAGENKSYRCLHLTIKMDIDIRKLYPVSSYRVAEKENLPSLCSKSL